MKEILIFRCSPHPAGVTDHLADYFAAGLRTETLSVRSITLRNSPVHACDGCGSCAAKPYKCKFAELDQQAYFFSLMTKAALVVFCAPIYFYALPAICTAFLNRAQELWQTNSDKKLIFSPGIVLLAAGRQQGKKLFNGATLSFSYFFKAGASKLIAAYGFRGLDNLCALEARPDIKENLFYKGVAWAKFCKLNNKF